MTTPEIHWLDEPEQHDYSAALSYLSLHYPPFPTCAELVKALHKAPVVEFKAKDIARASGLKLLDERNSHVEHDLEKIEEGKKLSPILLVRGDRLVIADGFHRLCAIYLHNEDAPIKCKITGMLP